MLLHFAAASCLAGPAVASPAEARADHVVHVSVDGLRADVITRMGPGLLPNLHRIVVEGVSTFNARTDYDLTNTLPNHVCQLTGRHVYGTDGHGVDFNSDDGTTIETAHGAYVAGVFDVVHDHGLSTALYAGKSKFAFIVRSWDGDHGAADITGADDGRDKIDRALILADTEALVDSFIAEAGISDWDYTFIHLRDLDSEGHAAGWCSAPYFEAAVMLDGLLGRIFEFVESDSAFAGRTALIVTADHGGFGTSHADPALAEDYTIPMLAWGPGAAAGLGLYVINPLVREDPGDSRPERGLIPQPVRNGDAACLALGLLGLPAVPGATIDPLQDLSTSPPAAMGEVPEVAITFPADGASYAPLDPVTVEVSASVEGGAVASVEFFVGWRKVGEDFSSPFTFEWPQAPLGDHTIAARAWSGEGLASVASIGISVPAVTGDTGDIPKASAGRVYPNPFGTAAALDFDLNAGTEVEMRIYDVRGRSRGVLFRGYFPEGNNTMRFRVEGIAPGLYFYRLVQPGTADPGRRPLASGKMMILR